MINSIVGKYPVRLYVGCTHELCIPSVEANARVELDIVYFSIQTVA